MAIEETMEGIVAIFIILVFMTMVIPALVSATGISFWWLIPSMVLVIIGIIFAIIKAWMD